jgi:hypothetical protein
MPIDESLAELEVDKTLELQNITEDIEFVADKVPLSITCYDFNMLTGNGDNTYRAPSSDKVMSILELLLKDIGYDKYIRTITFENQNNSYINKIFTNDIGITAFIEFHSNQNTQNNIVSNSHLILSYNDPKILDKIIPSLRKYKITNDRIEIHSLSISPFSQLI